MKVLSLHLTDRCNERCTFCVVGIPEIKGENIDRARLDSVLVENAGSGFDAVNLHGGEPTLQPGFIDTLQLIRDLGYPKVILQTNGRRLANMDFVRQITDLVSSNSRSHSMGSLRSRMTASPGRPVAFRPSWRQFRIVSRWARGFTRTLSCYARTSLPCRRSPIWF